MFLTTVNFSRLEGALPFCYLGVALPTFELGLPYYLAIVPQPVTSGRAMQVPHDPSGSRRLTKREYILPILPMMTCQVARHPSRSAAAVICLNGSQFGYVFC